MIEYDLSRIFCNLENFYDLWIKFLNLWNVQGKIEIL